VKKSKDPEPQFPRGTPVFIAGPKKLGPYYAYPKRIDSQSRRWMYVLMVATGGYYNNEQEFEESQLLK